MIIYLQLKNDIGVVVGIQYLHPTFEEWKNAVFDYCGKTGILSYFKVGSSEPVKVHLRYHPDIPKVSAAHHEMILNDTGELINIHSFMYFTIEYCRCHRYIPATR